jgi:hypothetical protein
VNLRRCLAVALVTAVAVAACGDDDERAAAESLRPLTDAPPADSGAAASAVTTTDTMAPPPTVVTSTTAHDPPASILAAPATTPTAPPPAPTEPPDETRPPGPTDARAPYPATVAPIDDATRARMSASWRPGCPVGLEDLRLLTLPHWDDAGESVVGELVVHADAAGAIVEAFRQLYEQRFPIARMELVDVYGGDDQASMRANNTSAFNCREIDGRPGVWSQHSYGRAVDVNPLVNPWVRGGQVDPPEGAPYADRGARVPGGLYAGDPAIDAFASVGWKWGGDWSGSKDYQHFSADGR